MSAYFVALLPAARRDLKRLPTEVHQRIVAAVSKLEENPRPPGSKKLVGSENEWRLRVGDYRVLYAVEDADRQVLIARVAHRREAYR